MLVLLLPAEPQLHLMLLLLVQVVLMSALLLLLLLLQLAYVAAKAVRSAALHKVTIDVADAQAKVLLIWLCCSIVVVSRLLLVTLWSLLRACYPASAVVHDCCSLLARAETSSRKAIRRELVAEAAYGQMNEEAGAYKERARSVPWSELRRRRKPGARGTGVGSFDRVGQAC